MRKHVRQEYEETRKEEKGGSLFLTIASTVMGFLIIAIIAVFFLFQVEEVVVEGNVHYTEEEIKQTVMIDFVSENTILASLFKRNVKINDTAFIESIHVDYMDRNKICITVNEKDVVGYVEDDDGICYYFNRDGLVVEETEGPVMTAEERMQMEESKNNESAGEEGEDGITAFVEETPVKNFVPLVKGLEYTIQEKNPEKEKSSEKEIVVDNMTVFNTLASLKQMINKDNIPPEYVEFDAEYNIYLIYESIEVRLGQDVDLENKMSTLAAIMPKLEGMSGTLMLENYSSIQSGVIFQKKE